MTRCSDPKELISLAESLDREAELHSATARNLRKIAEVRSISRLSPQGRERIILAARRKAQVSPMPHGSDGKFVAIDGGRVEGKGWTEERRKLASLKAKRAWARRKAA